MILDVNLLRSLVTLVSLALFFGIVAWAYRRSNGERFAQAEQLPFVDTAAQLPSVDTAAQLPFVDTAAQLPSVDTAAQLPFGDQARPAGQGVDGGSAR